MSEEAIHDPGGEDSNKTMQSETSTSPEYRSSDRTGYNAGNLSIEKSEDGFNLRNLINAHSLAFSIAFSVLLVVSGVILVLFSLPQDVLPQASWNLLRITVPGGEGVLFLTIGALLLVSPLIVYRFIFDALSYERDLRIKAQKSTREAQLLQDILTHDVRNYNQVSKLSAELLAEELKSNQNAQDLIYRLLDSIDGSTLLVERAKMLGKVISDYALDRHPVNVLTSIKRSMELIVKVTPERKINSVIKINSMPVAPLSKLDPESYPADVLADDLIDEVFANLFSNSVKYSEGEVFIGIEVTSNYDKQLRKSVWKIAISDTGKGIPDGLKNSLFSRYLEGAKGSGLGMSIVHALVVGRYGGAIKVSNRVDRDHSRGTVIELSLPSAH